MTTRSGATYTSMGDPTIIPSSSNPPDPPSYVARLEAAFTSFATDMRTQLTEIRKDLKESEDMANRRLNYLEHPELSLQRNRRTPPQEVRPSPPPRRRSTPLPTYEPPYGAEPRMPPLRLKMDTHPLGITPILMSPGRSLQNIGPDLTSLGDHHLRSILIHLPRSDIILLTHIEIRDIGPTTRMNN